MDSIPSWFVCCSRGAWPSGDNNVRRFAMGVVGAVGQRRWRARSAEEPRALTDTPGWACARVLGGSLDWLAGRTRRLVDELPLARSGNVPGRPAGGARPPPPFCPGDSPLGW